MSLLMPTNLGTAPFGYAQSLLRVRLMFILVLMVLLISYRGAVAMSVAWRKVGREQAKMQRPGNEWTTARRRSSRVISQAPLQNQAKTSQASELTVVFSCCHVAAIDTYFCNVGLASSALSLSPTRDHSQPNSWGKKHSQ